MFSLLQTRSIIVSSLETLTSLPAAFLHSIVTENYLALKDEERADVRDNAWLVTLNMATDGPAKAALSAFAKLGKHKVGRDTDVTYAAMCLVTPVEIDGHLSRECAKKIAETRVDLTLTPTAIEAKIKKIGEKYTAAKVWAKWFVAERESFGKVIAFCRTYAPMRSANVGTDKEHACKDVKTFDAALCEIFGTKISLKHHTKAILAKRSTVIA